MSKNTKHKRNGNLFDGWSVVHMCTGILFGWLMSPIAAIVVMAIWEPFEIFIISPMLAKKGITFGYESLRNSLSDIVFNTIGVLIGAFLIRLLFEPPFELF